ncbi:hypothetical protein N7509_013517 [Penicillium cosmopolitanum]|uniref:Uncharacterized protein n=1 Tax=Penicillium cosmopolitanum TaxID=1131564 RepID=A0A9W9VEP9_9EURO|nr:uncharacterized protein N7509_013517 [Penicillium cosmopolitanum]KAJ5376631.1 hypothetical protein N7509_013517 [Penicillium cosmopolitanum]
MVGRNSETRLNNAGQKNDGEERALDSMSRIWAPISERSAAVVGAGPEHDEWVHERNMVGADEKIEEYLNQ